jgi:DNA-binding GntR family transcriptional regulator
MKPAPRINLSDKIRATLQAEIESGQLSPGAHIEEQALMDRFGVSRTPAREAVMQLLSSGLLSLVPRQGAVVSGITLTEYVATLEILLELEGLAARFSARRMAITQRHELEKAAKACEKAALANDARKYTEVNRLFHEIIYDGSRNEVLARQLRAMRARMRHPQTSMFDRPGRVRESMVEHNGVLQAILAGDEDGAYLLMTAHISSGGNVYADAIATMTKPTPVRPVLKD